MPYKRIIGPFILNSYEHPIDRGLAYANLSNIDLVSKQIYGITVGNPVRPIYEMIASFWNQRKSLKPIFPKILHKSPALFSWAEGEYKIQI